MLTSLLTITLLAPTADAGVFPIKKVRIKKRINRDPKSVVVSGDPGTDDYADEFSIALEFFAARDTGDAAEPLVTLLTDSGELRRATERFTAKGLTFEDSPLGTPYFLSVAVRDAKGTTIGTAYNVEVTPTDSGAADADEGAEQDGGWLTDAGTIKLEGGAEVELSVGIRQQNNGDWKVVTRVKGDEDLTTAGIGDIEIQFEEPFEGPTPDENPITLSGQTHTAKYKSKVEAYTWDIDGDGQADFKTIDPYDWDFDGDGEADATDYDLSFVGDDGTFDFCSSEDFRIEGVTLDSKGNEVTRTALYCSLDAEAGYGDILLTPEPIDIE